MASNDSKGLKNLIDICGIDFIDSVNLANEDGDTPLLSATKLKQMLIVELLLDAGAFTNVRNKAGWTPLHVAGDGGPIELVQMLYKAGGNLNAQTKRGNTPLHLAIYS